MHPDGERVVAVGLRTERFGQGQMQAGGGGPEAFGVAGEVAAAEGRVAARRVEVAQRCQGQRPPLGPAGQVFVGDGQVDAVLAPHRQRLGHVVETDRVEGGRDLHVGVGPGCQAAEHLEDDAVVVDERRVRLLRSDRTHALGRLTTDDLQQRQRQLGIDQGVVDDLTVDLTDDRVFGDGIGELGLGPLTDEQVVVRAACVDDQTPHRRAAADELLLGRHGDERRAVAGEPALAGQVVRKQQGEAHTGAATTGSVSWNQ